MAQGNLSMAQMTREVMKYMKDNNISEEKFKNIQQKVMERYGVSSEDIEDQIKSMGIDPSLNNLSGDYEDARKVMGFQEKYKGKLKINNSTLYGIKNSKNDLEIILQDENVILKSYIKIDLTDNELNEFLCSYKKVRDNKMLNVSICENSTTYLY